MRNFIFSIFIFMHFSVGAYSYKLKLSPPSFVLGDALWKQVTVKALPSDTESVTGNPVCPPPRAISSTFHLSENTHLGGMTEYTKLKFSMQRFTSANTIMDFSKNFSTFLETRSSSSVVIAENSPVSAADQKT